MTDINISFCRELLKQAHEIVKLHFPDINLKKDGYVWNGGRDHWEFHGPDGFYWHGNAANAYDARYHGWMAWLRKKNILDDIEE